MHQLQQIAKLNAEAIEALRAGDPITARSKCLFVEEEVRRYMEAGADTQPFPIQGETTTTRPVRRLRQSWIPRWLAEVAYEYYASQYGKQQSLDRLAERGGFGRDELIGLIRREI